MEAWVVKPTEFTFSVASSLCWSEFTVVVDPEDWTLLAEWASGEPTTTVCCLLGVTVLGTGRYVSSRLAMSSSSKKSKYILEKYYMWWQVFKTKSIHLWGRHVWKRAGILLRKTQWQSVWYRQQNTLPQINRLCQWHTVMYCFNSLSFLLITNESSRGNMIFAL